MATLTRASQEWATRPADQRFMSLTDLHNAVTRHRVAARTATLPFSALHAKASEDGAVLLNGRTETAALTHWSFGQLSQRAGAPPSYLRSLPAPLAVECINHGLSKRNDDGDGIASVLFDTSGALTCRSILTDRYSRIWNDDVTRRLLELADHGPWQPAPAAYDGSRGLYASQQDMFAFLVDNDRRIFESAPGGGLSRGFFVWNSEVGATSFGIMAFYYMYICGNHLVWDAANVTELRLPHIGNVNDRAFSDLAFELRRYADSSATETELQISSAQRFSLGNDKEEVLDKIFGLRVPQLSRKRVADAYALAEQRTDWYGSPRSAWGMTNALTEMARDLPFADERVSLDRAAGKVMALAF